jgi:hypothetical protein
VQIVPLMSSVNRGKNDADRVEEVVSGPPSDSAFLPVFLPVDRSSSPAVHPVITPGYHRCVASPSASRVSSGLGREPFEAALSQLFSAVCKTASRSGSGRSGSCWVCLFPPLPWVKVVTANQWGDEECISASRARSSHSPRTFVSYPQPETKPKSRPCAAMCSSDRGVSLLRVESELEIPCEQRASKHHPEELFSFSRT